MSLGGMRVDQTLDILLEIAHTDVDKHTSTILFERPTSVETATTSTADMVRVRIEYTPVNGSNIIGEHSGMVVKETIGLIATYSIESEFQYYRCKAISCYSDLISAMKKSNVKLAASLLKRYVGKLTHWIEENEQLISDQDMKYTECHLRERVRGLLADMQGQASEVSAYYLLDR